MANTNYTDEEWRVIACAPDYAVSNLGRVKRVVPDWQGKYLGRVLKGRVNRGGYHYVTLRINRTTNLTRTVHKLVCLGFNGDQPPNKPHCAHRDGDKLNNMAGNLYWATPSENVADKVRHGRVSFGTRNGRHTKPERTARGERGAAAKLTEQQVREVLDAPRVKGSGIALADRYGVTPGLICSIRKGRRWKHLTA